MDQQQAAESRDIVQSGAQQIATTVQGAPIPGAEMAQAQASAVAVPAAADDLDVIEPEWVSAVTALMHRYKNNPYELSQAMTALRKDYLQKRYGQVVEETK